MLVHSVDEELSQLLSPDIGGVHVVSINLVLLVFDDFGLDQGLGVLLDAFFSGPDLDEGAFVVLAGEVVQKKFLTGRVLLVPEQVIEGLLSGVTFMSC